MICGAEREIVSASEVKGPGYLHSLTRLIFPTSMLYILYSDAVRMGR